MTIPKLTYKPVTKEETSGKGKRGKFLVGILLLSVGLVLTTIGAFVILRKPTGLHGLCGNSLHASCKIKWTFGMPCESVRNKIVSQIKAWTGLENCKDGGEKCLYTLISLPPNGIKATHTTPKRKYVDDLTFTFTDQGQGCQVQGYSTSEVWYAILDFGTNYCNLHNLITGSGLNTTAGYQEDTSDHVCTQYSSADCEKY